MPQIEKHAHGCFCWPELSTTDSKGAKEFYSGLFGWASEDMPMGPDSVYTVLKLQGLELGAMYEMEAARREMKIPPHWLLYVSVDDVDAITAKARELGAEVLAGPLDVSTAGRMTMFRDPQGAALAAWQANENIGARLAGVAGTLCWAELATNDVGASKSFYTALFGWAAKASNMPGMPYTEWMAGGQPAGGMIEMDEKWQGVPPHWMPYFQVDDCDASAEKAKQLGGNVCVPPTDIPGVGRFAVLNDPQGAFFSIVRLNMPA